MSVCLDSELVPVKNIVHSFLLVAQKEDLG